MLKWGRNYRAEFIIGHWDKNYNRIDDEVIEIKYPNSTCNLMTDLGTYISANRAGFQFYNLSPSVRAKLWKDIYQAKKYIKMSMYAGYGDTMPLIFRGMVFQCLSSKPSGSTNWITDMQVFRQGPLKEYGYVNSTFSPGTEFKDIIKALIAKNPDIDLGYLTPDIPPLTRSRTFIGQTMDVLRRHYGQYEIFVNEDLKLNVIGENDVLPGNIQVITDSTGLLGSPRRANAYVELDTIFEPQLRIGQGISLLSQTMPEFNRAYKVCDVRHQGIISPTECGKLITTVTLSMFDTDPRILKKSDTAGYEGKQTQGIWIKPCKGQRISSPFGWRVHPIYKTNKFHSGIDIAASANEPVVAPANGRVISARWYGGYGNYIEIDHGKDKNGKVITTAYGHLKSYIVNHGQNVKQGETIGYVGSTGSSDGPHLHFEVYVNGKATNPIPYIGTY